AAKNSEISRSSINYINDKGRPAWISPEELRKNHLRQGSRRPPSGKRADGLPTQVRLERRSMIPRALWAPCSKSPSSSALSPPCGKIRPLISLCSRIEMPETSATTSTAPSVDQARIIALLATELGSRPSQVAAAVELLDDGATVPFIARYRKEA